MKEPHIVYPGTFDPLTLGHLDVITRTLNIFPRMTLAVASTGRDTLFSIDQRLDLAGRAVDDLGLSDRCAVQGFTGLIVDYLKGVDAGLVVRGIRAGPDFEYERAMESMNRHLDSSFEAIMFFARPQLAMISGTLVRDVARCGGSLDGLVPGNVAVALRERFSGNG